MLHCCMNIDKDIERCTPGFEHWLSSAGDNKMENLTEVKFPSTLKNINEIILFI